MQTLRLHEADLLSAPELDALRGTHLFAPHYRHVIRDSARVEKPDGSLLTAYAKDAIPRAVCQATFDDFKDMPIGWTDSRGNAAGGRSFQRADSNTTRWRRMNSDVVGFLDSDPRNPYCRMTMLSRDHAALDAALPLAVEVNRVFRELAPDRWEAQRAYVETISPDFVIPGTVFTSITVNRNERTAAHTDANDYKPGLGVMAVLEGEALRRWGAHLPEVSNGGRHANGRRLPRRRARMARQRPVRWSPLPAIELCVLRP